MQLRALHVLKKWNPNMFQPKKKEEEQPTPEVQKSHQQASALAIGLKWKKKATENPEATPLVKEPSIQESEEEQKEDEEEEEKEEDPTKNFRLNMLKAILLCIFGTAIVAFFSDPMVDVLSGFAAKVKINPFYISFLITPYCSNASEMISSLIFASKKRKENASVTYSQLYGAATMNNTMCLGIFFALVYFRRLVWAFTAETLSILAVTWIMGAICAFKRDFPLWWIFPVLSLYPFSLFLVWLLEYVADWT